MILKKVATGFDIVFAILLFTLPLSMAIPNILFGLLIILFLFKKQKIFNSSYYIKFVFLFVIYLIFKALFFKELYLNINIYKHLFLLAFLSLLTLQIKNVFLVKKGFVLGVFLAVLISTAKIFLFYYKNNYLPLGNTSEVPNLLLIERPYLGFMSLLAVIIITDFYKKLKTHQEKIIYFFFTILLVLFIYLIVARLALVLVLFFILLKGLLFFKTSKTKIIISILVLILCGFGLVLGNKNLKKRFHIKESYKETLAVLKNQEARFVIWNCVNDQISNKQFNLFFGYKKRHNIQKNLDDCYSNTIKNVSKKEYYLKTKFNTHNQFFDLFLNGGITVLLLFSFLFTSAIFTLKKSLYAYYTLFSFCMFLIVENIFHRQLGVYLFAVFVPLFFLKKEMPRNE